MLPLLTLNALMSAFIISPLSTRAPSKTEGIGKLSLAATDWNKTYGGASYDYGYSMVQTGDGGYAIAGLTYSYGAGSDDFWLVKTDSSGSILWNKTYGGTNEDDAESLIQTGDGGYAIAGLTYSYGASTGDFYLVKTNSSGAMQWNKTYGGANNDDANSVIQTGDGGYAIAGLTFSYGTGGDSWLVKTNSFGAMQWNKTYGGANYECAFSVVQTGDGGYAIAGLTNSYGAGHHDFYLVKTNSSGDIQWNKTYGGADEDYAHSLVQTGDGGYAITGCTYSYGAGGGDFWLVKTDSSGNMQWNKTYGGTNYEFAESVVQTGDGGYAMAGCTSSYGAGSDDFWLVKTDSSGNMQWNKTYGGTDYDYAYSLAQTTDGGYAIAGYTWSYGAGNGDFWLVKLTPSTIYINADGSIDPPTAPIQRSGNVYTFTDNIFTSVDVGIMIARDNMTLDGAGYTLDGGGVGSTGIWLSAITNVTVKNVNIHAFSQGIFLEGSSHNMIVENNVTDCPYGIELMSSSWNTLAGNHVTNSDYYGILLCPPESGEGSSNNTLTGNTLTNNVCGVDLSWSSINFVSGNIIETSNDTGIWIEYSSDNVLTCNNLTINRQGLGIYSCSNNSIYHNNFVNNSYKQVSTSGSTNVWDDGYPSGGNYWSDYNGTDLFRGSDQNETGGDGIGDSHYLIDVNNQDNYPLMKTWSARYTRYEWPAFHHDSVRTGYTESPAPSTNQTKWNYTTDGFLTSSPAVADGKVYVGSYYGTVYCLDASTGTRIWSYLTKNRVCSSPAVANGRVYVGSSDKTVYCLDALTGTSIWNYTTGQTVESSPAVADGKVYVGSDDDKVYCLDASTGALVWNYTTGDDVWSSPAVADGKVYVGSFDRKVYCLDASTGALVWNYTTGDDVWSSPAVADGKVYVGSNDKTVYCLDAFTGASIWNYTTGNWVYSSPAVAYGRVYVGSYNCKLHCLDALTGTSIWNYTTTHWVPSSPAVADGKVYVGSLDGKVYCLNALTGASIWNYATGGQIDSSPAVADGVVYVGSYDYVLYAFGSVARVPEDLPTIQAAINAASPGATIWIAPGIYHESIIINKTITLIGKPGSEPTFNGGGSGIAITIVPSGSGSTIVGIAITNWDQGILVNGASGCKIYDNIMSLINQNGITLQGSNASNNLVYSNIFEQNSIAVSLTSSTSNNTIYDNIISLGSVGLDVESSGNVVYANIITENELAINIKNSNGNKFYHNDFISNNVQLSVSASTGNVWDNGYPSGGNYWACGVSVDSFSGPQQNISGSDGIVDLPYTVATNNVDNYPLLKPFSLHSVGITSFVTSKTIVGQSFNLTMNLKIQNLGLSNETFGLTIRANATLLTQQTVSLPTRNSTTLTITWNTTNCTMGNYTLVVLAGPVPDEADSTDNSFCCWVVVTVPGNIKYDSSVNILDAIMLGNSFLATPGSPNWNPNADINGDNAINILDAIIIGNHFNEYCP